MNPKNDQDFAQFQGEFDFSQAPDPTFAEMLRRRMADERVAAPPQRATVLASSQPSSWTQVSKPTVTPPPSRGPIWAAMAALLVVAIIGASVWQISGLMNEGQNAGAPEVVLPVDASVTPGADVELTSESLAPGFWPDTVVDDVIVGSGIVQSGDEDKEIVRIYGLDAQTGELLWEHRGWFGYSPASDGETLYLLKEEVSGWHSTDVEIVTAQDEPYDPAETQTVSGISLVALDPYTGEIEWEYEVPELTYSIEHYMFWASPLIIDGVVYLANWQSVIAVDAKDGSALWQTSTRFPTPTTYRGLVGLATYSDRPVVVGSDGYILVFAPESGNVIAHHQLSLDTYAEQTYSADVEVISHPAGVIALWSFEGSNESLSVTMLIDPMSGEIHNSVTSDATSGRSAFAEDGSVAFVANKWSPGNIIMRILGRGDRTSVALVWIDAVNGEMRLGTDYVRVDYEYFSLVAANDGTYACFRSSLLDCFDRTGTRYQVTDSSNRGIWWTEISDGRLYYTTDQGLFVVDLP